MSERVETLSDETSGGGASRGGDANARGALAVDRWLPLTLALTLVGVSAAVGVALGQPPRSVERALPPPPLEEEPFDHSAYFAKPFSSGPEVTLACLGCHSHAAGEVMQTSHWTWSGHGADEGGGGYGKRNLLNNFCIGVQSNWPRCTSCHAGYGWSDGGFFETATEAQVDCLVCHADPTVYQKDPAGAGLPAPGVDLRAAARSVGPVGRGQCGTCHFSGGGGDAVKHGDLDGTMLHPSEQIDVHMGRLDMVCTACHHTEQHQVSGRLLPFGDADERRVSCEDCHAGAIHADERIARHEAAVSCQACHIPYMALEAATKLSWDWSQAGQDPSVVATHDPQVARDPHLYNKKKGRFTYGQRVPPEYRWYDGRSTRLLPGERIDPARPVPISAPQGSVSDPAAKLYPFKIHRGRQPYDLEHGYLLVPKTFGPGGYWTDFDWDAALRLGAEASGFPYSGRHGFADTEMAWPLNHMVQSKERAMQCADCHGETGRLDWRELGYPGDPARHGGRAQRGLLSPRGPQ
ncbi:MAG: tetrathionate reductase family octaheme c-type cytochrome [Planctomycetes bacterium]|nr:tetrathionate reductase family octaheme c-type cytochrome [Planctomycetota bacterium]